LCRGSRTDNNEASLHAYTVTDRELSFEGEKMEIEEPVIETGWSPAIVKQAEALKDAEEHDRVLEFLQKWPMDVVFKGEAHDKLP